MWPCQMACGVMHIHEKEFQNAQKRVRLETCPAKIIGAFPSSPCPFTSMTEVVQLFALISLHTKVRVRVLIICP